MYLRNFIVILLVSMFANYQLTNAVNFAEPTQVGKVTYSVNAAPAGESADNGFKKSAAPGHCRAAAEEHGFCFKENVNVNKFAPFIVKSVSGTESGCYLTRCPGTPEDYFLKNQGGENWAILYTEK